MRYLALALLLFIAYCSAEAQDSMYSMLVVEKTTHSPDSLNKMATRYKITHYTENDAIDLASKSSSTNINQIVKVLNELGNKGWSIVSATDNFYFSLDNVENMFKENVTNVSSQEYILVKGK